jgi:hypothetical protein
VNLEHDMLTGARDGNGACGYYAKEFLDARRKQSSPYVQGLRLTDQTDTHDADQRVISEEQLQQQAAGKGQNRGWIRRQPLKANP